MEIINDENYELWLVRYADGCLTADEREAVEQWLEGHPDAAAELALYNEAPRLERDETVRFAGEPRRQTRPLWSTGWHWVAAAAVVLLLLTPVTVSLLKGSDEAPMQVAQTTPAETNPAAPAIVNAPVMMPATAPVSRREEDSPVDDQTALQPLENYIPSRPMTLPVLLAEELPVESPVIVVDSTVEEMPVVYVDNLFVEDTTSEMEQRLLALNDATKESLQGTWLGRRLARRLPDNVQLLARVDEVRERTPRGIRMVADMIRVYNETNK